MAVELRMIGDPDEIARVIHEMEKVLDVMSNGRSYEARGRFGVRTYAEVRIPTAPKVTVEQAASPAEATSPAITPKANRIELP